MTVINLKRYYYPLVKTDVFVEVPDEVADALLHLRREENNRKSKMFYHKAYFSLDCEDGIENEAIGWAQLDLCQYFGQKKLKDYATFFSSSSSFC